MWPWAWLTWMDGLSGAASTDGELRAGILGLVGGGGVAYEDGWTGARVQARLGRRTGGQTAMRQSKLSQNRATLLM